MAGPVAVARLGLAGDEQADLSVHGGLDKAVYGYPSEHLAFWQTKRLEHSVSLWDEVLPSGLVGENLSLQGLLEAQVWVGDELHFPGCVLRVTAPREQLAALASDLGLRTLILGAARAENVSDVLAGGVRILDLRHEDALLEGVKV